ncbi:MAG: hypothetical protein UU85_C0004G0044 [Candidatus Wolfebacteria bacterium GW2011_GWA2_42_10]|uniref:ABC transporter permease n=2 Tax=Candidatus Wolfeibacteriota TaxID=1752735 RepID=A0A0G0XK36_9BACT|nr:MAG: hypothetical protein UU38_C0001G0106 [Candidatus Wolfebacteria bacterium GW2011_GWB1_41_12]KKS25285.1 MAG: hypothetical protein UU85_C0004G0044 [Candidatus Wolfebacteria bacterium GW2011_GWA2_42_10]KKT56725.1 MAG: hypothetical protein UW50_C0001G0294 [Candidatus Wolfebacteria bacterium GW2011_GWA1_44_24]
MKNFFKKIQAADESVKKRWLFIMSAVSAVIVIGFWLIYLRYSIEAVGNHSDKAEIGFWRIFKTGLKAIAIQVKEKFGNLLYGAMGERTITIE